MKRNLALAIFTLIASHSVQASILHCDSTAQNGPRFLIILDSPSSNAAIFSKNSQEGIGGWKLEYGKADAKHSEENAIRIRGSDESEIDWSIEPNCYAIRRRTLEFNIVPDESGYFGIATISTNVAMNPEAPECKIAVKPDGPPFAVRCEVAND